MAIIASGASCARARRSTSFAELEGRVWHKTIDKRELDAIRSEHDVISTRLFGGRTIVHVLAPTAAWSRFRSGRAGGLEDVYFSTFVRGRAERPEGDDMFRQIAGFELRYHAALAALLGHGAHLRPADVRRDRVRQRPHRRYAGNVKKNSPFAVGVTLQTMSIFAVFIMAAFVANVVIRDDETGYGQIVHSTRVSKFDYLFGRFTGAFVGRLRCRSPASRWACCSDRSCHGSIPRRWGHFDPATIYTPTSRSRCQRWW